MIIKVIFFAKNETLFMSFRDLCTQTITLRKECRYNERDKVKKRKRQDDGGIIVKIQTIRIYSFSRGNKERNRSSRR